MINLPHLHGGISIIFAIDDRPIRATLFVAMGLSAIFPVGHLLTLLPVLSPILDLIAGELITRSNGIILPSVTRRFVHCWRSTLCIADSRTIFTRYIRHNRLIAPNLSLFRPRRSGNPFHRTLQSIRILARASSRSWHERECM